VRCLSNQQGWTVARAVNPIARNFRMLGSCLLNAVGVSPFLKQLVSEQETHPETLRRGSPNIRYDGSAVFQISNNSLSFGTATVPIITAVLEPPLANITRELALPPEERFLRLGALASVLEGVSSGPPDTFRGR